MMNLSAESAKYRLTLRAFSAHELYTLQPGPMAQAITFRAFGAEDPQTMKILIIRTLTLIWLIAAFEASGQDQEASRERLLAAARETMLAARYCALITLDSWGRPQARTLDPFPPDENMVVWLGTNPRSRKVAAIRRNPQVTLYYFDREAQAYVTIYGIARLVTDPKAKVKWWKDEWKSFYPDRAKDYLLIRVAPQKLEVVNVTKDIVGDSHTWKPPSVTFQEPR